MKKNRLFITLTLIMAVTAVLMCGCGSSYKSEEAKMVATESAAGSSYADIYDAAPMAEAPAEEAVEEEGLADTEVSEEAAQEKTARKLIKNVDMSVETEQFDLLMDNIRSKVDMLGGYIENSDIYNGSYTSNYRSRNASLKIRIPSEKLDIFIDDVAEQTNITNKSESVEDVTLQYVDLESHKKALRAEEESLITMLEKAETIEDIIAIQSQLTDVRYKIESMESQLRTYDNKIQYSTIWLHVNEVAQYEPYEPKTAGERISEGFTRNVHNVVDGIENFFIELIIAIPLILVAVLIIGIGVVVMIVIIRMAEKQSKKKKEQINLMRSEREKDRKKDADKQL